MNRRQKIRRRLEIGVGLLLLVLAAWGAYESFYKHGAAYVFSKLGLATPVPELTHQQNVWLHALEWCESSGTKTAINEKDLDGTPSYYSFQFKPSTFKQYGIKYGLLSKRVTDETVEAKLASYELQRQMVMRMMFDRSVRWNREFPDCVRRLGPPPVVAD